MPPKVEACVADFMSAPRNVKKWPDATKRKQAAFAICNAAIKQGEVHHGYVTALEGIVFADDAPNSWVHLLPYGDFLHDVWGQIKITPEKVGNMVRNFKDKVRGQMLDFDYAHKRDNAKGGKAAGWIIALDQREDGLWGLV